MRFLKTIGVVLGLLLLAGLSFFLTSKWLEGPVQRTSPRLGQGMPGKPATAVVAPKGPGTAQVPTAK